METWSFSWAVRNLIVELIMPPGIWVLLMLFLIKKHGLIKKNFFVLGLALIWFSSTTFFAHQLTQLVGYFLDWPEPFILKKVNQLNVKVQAKINGNIQSKNTHVIVVLGSGRQMGALDLPEYQHQNLSPQSMERLRSGARLAKVTNLPILLTGGAPDRVNAKDLSEARVMSMVLKQELGLSARWLEEQSNTTQENASQSAQILKKEGIHTIYLVTHFWHMPRAKAQFEKHGFEVISVAVGFYQKKQWTPFDFYPSGEGFQRVRWIWHEFLGNLWYRIKL